MSTRPARPPFDTTSAAGAMLMRHVRTPMLVGCMLYGLGTSSAHGPSESALRSHRAILQTTAGAPVPVVDPAGAALGELRRLSGLTWDQLARLFNVKFGRDVGANGDAGQPAGTDQEPEDQRARHGADR